MAGGGATYAGTLPSDKDWVRFRIGDTDTPDNTHYSDDEINAVLGLSSNKYFAAADLAESMLNAQTGGAVEKAVGDLRIRWSDSPKSAYQSLINELREEGARVLQQSASGSPQSAFARLGTTGDPC